MLKKIKYILLILLIFFILPQKVYAAPIIKIDSFPSTTISGQEFDINFSALGLSIDTNYYIKSLGGTDFNEVDTWNTNWLQQNAAWSNMPIFISNSEGSTSGILKSRFAVTTLGGNKDYKVRIRKTDGTTNYDSDVISISVSIPTPSPTQSPTDPPTQAPTQAPTASPTIKPTPTKTGTPKPTPKPTIEAEVTNEPENIISDVKITDATPVGIVAGATTTKKSPILAIILIISGVGFLGYGGYLLYNGKYGREDGVEENS